MWPRYFNRIIPVLIRPDSLRGSWETGTPDQSPLSTVICVSALLAFVSSVILMSIQFLPIVLYITQGIPAVRILYVLPILVIFTFVFLVMAVILLTGFWLSALLFGGAISALLLQQAKGGFRVPPVLWNCVWDTAGCASLFCVPMLVLLGVKYFHLPPYAFALIMTLTVAAVFLLAIRAWRVVTGASLWLGAPTLVVALPALIFLWVFLPKITPWIT